MCCYTTKKQVSDAYRMDCYKNAKEKTEKIMRILEQAMSGKSLAKACADENVQTMWMRRYIEKDIGIGCELQPVAKLTEEDWLSWDDILWGDIISEKNVPAPDGFVDMLEKVSSEILKPRENSILYMHYRDGMTLQAISDHFLVTKSRIQAIKTDILKRLRKPDVRIRLQYGEDYENALAELQTAQAEYDKAYLAAINNQSLENKKVSLGVMFMANGMKQETKKLSGYTTPEHLAAATQRLLAATSLEDLKFSKRSCNALCRHFHRTYLTAEDVASLSGQLLYVRGLGTKCIHEISNVMYKRFGIDMLYGTENAG